MSISIFTHLPNGNLRLEEKFEHPVWVAPGIQHTVTVPAEFETDGATIPRALWSIIGPPMRGNHLIPALIHDYLCVMADTYPKRLMADTTFFALLREYKVHWFKRSMMYLGVRFYGRFFWRKKASQECVSC